MTQLLDDAADALERRLFFARMTDRYEELRSDVEAWHEIESERALEEPAVHDSSG